LLTKDGLNCSLANLSPKPSGPYESSLSNLSNYATIIRFGLSFCTVGDSGAKRYSITPVVKGDAPGRRVTNSWGANTHCGNFN
jgi:hypothetical protein